VDFNRVYLGIDPMTQMMPIQPTTTSPNLLVGNAAHGVMCGRLDRHHLGHGINAKIDAVEIHDIGESFLRQFIGGDRDGRAIGIGTAIRGGVFHHRFGTRIRDRQ